MGCLIFILLTSVEILIISLLAELVTESPALLFALVIWYFIVLFVAIISGIAWLKEAQNSTEWSPKFTIIFTWKTVSPALIIPAGLFALSALTPDFGVLPILLTIILGPVAGTILLDRIESFPYSPHKCSFCRIAIISAISFALFVMIIGWVWAWTIDDRVEHFFGKGSVSTELAYQQVGLREHNVIPNPGYIVWQITSITNTGNLYCARLQFYTWMRMPTHERTDCFGIVLKDAIFIPSETNHSVRPQDKSFRARGTSDSWTEIQGLKWQDGTLTLTLTPYFPLTDLVLEFIDDGDIILTLLPSDATTDSEAGTLTWAVEDQPWETGDFLRFRIRAQRLPATPTPAP